MDPEEYDRIGALEEAHWRYRAIRQTLLSVLRRETQRGAPLRRILDAGCGTGGTLRALAELAPAVGVDVHPRALALARRRWAGPLVRGDVACLPFAAGSFDAVVSVDVLYHRRVEDDARALAELARVCRPGGTLVLWLPAYAWLRSSHDAIVHTARRYSRKQVRELARRTGLVIQHLSYVHAPVLLAAVAQRGLERLRGSPSRSSLRPAPRLVNELLERTLSLEGQLAQRVALPFGLSLLAVLRPPAAPPA
jgi:SAM-dependent methyltransferase